MRLLADGRKVSARIILISTGAAPVLEPDVPGREYAITSNEIFDLPELPKRLLIVGAAISRSNSPRFSRGWAQKCPLPRGAKMCCAGLTAICATGVREGLAHAGVKLNFGMLPTRIEKAPTGYRVSLTKGTRSTPIR